LRIVILTGGTGSIALQQGIYRALESRLDGIETKLIVNAYDNGLSTGLVRQVMSRRILGPSDVRKNHTTRLRLLDEHSPWLNFLDNRFTVKSRDALSHCMTQVTLLVRSLDGKDAAKCHVVFDSIEEFFRQDTASKIAYDNFSLANILYAGLAAKNAYSLRFAATAMASIIGIPDSVLLNDDESLFLGAITRSGRKISDEGDIVCWSNASDPIMDTFFTDASGHEAVPMLCLEAWEAILGADLILLSSGTLWSSLIPTYASRGFKDAIRDSKAKIVMIMNRQPDKDTFGQTASDLVNVLVPRYFEPGRLHILVDAASHPDLRKVHPSCLENLCSLTQVELSSPKDPQNEHNPAKLAHAIGRVFFNDCLDSDAFVFDYDDTLVARNNEYPLSSRFNVDGLCHLNGLTDIAICTGNTIRALNFGESTRENAEGLTHKPLLVFADGGINEYTYDDQFLYRLQVEGGITTKECLAPESLLTANPEADIAGIINLLRRAGIDDAKIDNRGDAIIAIKPIDPGQRNAVTRLARSIVQRYGLEVRESGRTTIEIRHPGLSKAPALKHLWATRPHISKITYIGDECDTGNDHDIATLADARSELRCLRVSDPSYTAFFIATLITCLIDHGKH
jgi:2-phospho-L-lactate transferase/gluconeogenesis factor (CofD/UPF0052 family)